MNLMTRILISIVACILIMTGCQKSTKRGIMVLDEVMQQTDCENKNIKRIEITGEVNSIEEGYFLRYSSLEHINVAEENEYFKSIDGVLYTKDGSAVVAYPIGRAETEYIIPEQCVAIYSYAFAESDLKNVTLSENMYEIGYAAFERCDRLQEIHIPKGVYYIAPGAFLNCGSLVEISVDKRNLYYSDVEGVLFNSVQDTLHTYPSGRKENCYTVPKNCVNLNDYSFSGAGFLEEISVAGKLEHIGMYAFEGTNVTSLQVGDETVAVEGLYEEKSNK